MEGPTVVPLAAFPDSAAAGFRGNHIGGTARIGVRQVVRVPGIVRAALGVRRDMASSVERSSCASSASAASSVDARSATTSVKLVSSTVSNAASCTSPLSAVTSVKASWRSMLASRAASKAVSGPSDIDSPRWRRAAMVRRPPGAVAGGADSPARRIRPIDGAARPCVKRVSPSSRRVEKARRQWRFARNTQSSLRRTRRGAPCSRRSRRRRRAGS